MGELASPRSIVSRRQSVCNTVMPAPFLVLNENLTPIYSLWHYQVRFSKTGGTFTQNWEKRQGNYQACHKGNQCTGSDVAQGCLRADGAGHRAGGRRTDGHSLEHYRGKV